MVTGDGVGISPGNVEIAGDRLQNAYGPGVLVRADRLVDAYTRFFYDYREAPLLVVNAAEINFVDSDEDFQMLLEQIRKIRSGRHFFNPVATAI